MNNQFAIISQYLILLALIFFVETASYCNKKYFIFLKHDLALTIFNISYFLFFVFAPLNIILFGQDAVRQTYVFERFGYGNVVTAASLIACYLLFVAGYFVQKSKVGTVVLVINVEKYAHLLRVTKYVAFLFVTLGLVGMVYHVTQVGGVFDAIRYSPCLRTGECGFDGKFLFLRQFNYFLATAFMLFWASYFDKGVLEKTFPKVDTCLLVLFMVLFIFYALTTNGRREFLYPITMSLCVLVLTGDRRPLGYGLLLLALVVWVSLGLSSSSSFLWAKELAATQPTFSSPLAKELAASQSTSSSDGLVFWIYLKVLYFNTVKGLADSFMHFVAMQHVDLWQFGFLSDLAELPQEFLPSKLIGFERARGFVGATSEFILGHRLGKGLSGDEPPGLHGYLLINFGYVGMFALFFLMGKIFRFLSDRFRPLVRIDAVGWLLYIFVFWGLIELLREGSFALVLKSRASWWLAIGIFSLVKFYQTRSNNRPLQFR